MRLGWVSLSFMASIFTTLLSVWMWDSPLEQATFFGAAWLVTGVIGGWWITASDSLSAAAPSVDSTVPAVLTKVQGQRITTRQTDGTELVWTIESPRKASLETGQRLWLASPAMRGKYVLGVAEPQAETDKAPAVLWPAEVA